MGLQEKKLKVMKEVDYVEKTGEVKFGKTKYSYAEASKVIGAIRESMIENGLTISVSTMFSGGLTEPESKNQGVTRVNLQVTLTDSESGESEQTQIAGEGQDSGDKGVYKATTGALKYWFLTNFVLPTGDDPEATDSEDFRTNRPKPKSNDKPKSRDKANSKSEAVKQLDAHPKSKAIRQLAGELVGDKVSETDRAIMRAFAKAKGFRTSSPEAIAEDYINSKELPADPDVVPDIWVDAMTWHVEFVPFEDGSDGE